MSNVPHGEPYAGKLHVRFDEGEDVPCGGVSLYSTPHCFTLAKELLGWEPEIPLAEGLVKTIAYFKQF